MNALRTWFRPETVHAHCDIPCGIYSPQTAQLAAKTVATMVKKIQEADDELDGLDRENTIGRMVAVKEEHAQTCKKEILILWTDYFKPEHLKLVPDLHDEVWKTTNLCSKNKQNVDAKAAQDLVRAVDRVAAAFEKVEKTKARTAAKKG